MRPNGSGKVQDGGLLTSNTYTSAPRQDINEILTATPVFSGSSFPLDFMGIHSDLAESGKLQDGNPFASNACWGYRMTYIWPPYSHLGNQSAGRNSWVVFIFHFDMSQLLEQIATQL